jgi:transcriptional regulator with XRE-family HTH domain
MSFRENLREAIDFCGLEQKELAYKTDIPLRSIENYLRGNASIPSADKAVKIAQVLGVTVEYLVTGKNTKDLSTSVEPEIKQLVRSIHHLPEDKQRVVIKNAISLSEMLKDK